MARRKLFTRISSPEDVGPSANDQPPESPSSEIVVEAPAEEVVEGEKPQSKKERAARARSIRPPVANLSLVRRERRALLRERERRIRDLGGLLLEMYRRDQFREDLIVEHCAQTMGVENRIHELEAILARGHTRQSASTPHCVCGAPLLFGARFCANCGRPTDLGNTGELCARCLQPLAPGAGFCASCGAVVNGGDSSEKPIEQTISHASPAEKAPDDQASEREDVDR